MTAAALKLVPFAFLCFLIATLGYVLRRGQRAERACILTITIGSLLSAVAAHSTAMWHDTETGILVVDIATLAAFVVIMGTSNRFWPLWITAFQIITVMTHLARFVKPKTVPIAYAIAEQLWVYPMLVILIVATNQQYKRTISTNNYTT